MLLDISFNAESVSIQIDNPRNPDYEAVFADLDGFLRNLPDSVSGLDFRGLVPRMVKGVAGCENGCPADAKELVSRGYNGFELEYVEGGILSASAKSSEVQGVSLKLFPDF